MTNQPQTTLDRVRDAVAEALGDAYHCTRDWSAWSYGTMSQDDFMLAWEDEDFVQEMARAVVTAAQPVVATVSELDALPAGTVVLDERGRAWTAFWPVTHNVDMPARSHVTVNRWQCADGGVVERYGWFGGEFMEGNSTLTVLHLPEVARG